MNKTIKKVCFISGTRAEFGLLKILIEKFYKSSIFETYFLVTGSHISKKHGKTIHEIIESNIPITNIVDLNIKNDSAYSITQYIATGVKKFGIEFEKLKPDLLVVLGDRYEIISAVIPACILNIPIAHIHGGELTEGAVDDAIRHSVSKFSHLHFVANEVYRRRVIQMGEHPSKVFNVGALALDAINNIKYLSKIELENNLDISLKPKSLIVTYHPETIINSSSLNDIRELFRAFDKFKDIQFIFTLPNADAGHDKLINHIKIYADKNNNCKVFSSLGQVNYFSLLKFVDGVIGNSSSGILEVPYFNKGTINIGKRQKGRVFGESVINCDLEMISIKNAIKLLYSDKFKDKLKSNIQLYGNKGASERIYKILCEVDFSKLTKKSFYDLHFE
jgi:GDP/UDP-N,N'-diacetylbacillosamine 2-epimerase (hydrolysing)